MLRKKGRMNFSVQLAVSVMKWQQGAQSLVAVINMQINCCGIMKWPNFPHSQSLLIRKLPQASYPHPSEGRQNEKHNHRKLTQLITWTQPHVTQWSYEPCCVGPPKTDGSWWRVLTKCGPLEEGMANHFSILALRTPWTVWKGKKIRHSKMNSPGSLVSHMLRRTVEK